MVVTDVVEVEVGVDGGGSVVVEGVVGEGDPAGRSVAVQAAAKRSTQTIDVDRIRPRYARRPPTRLRRLATRMITSDRLRAVPLFEGLADEDLERLAACSETRDLAAGEALFDEGDPADQAFVIEDGEIEIIKWTGTRPTLLIVRRPPEVIGEMALLHESRRSASARSRGDSRVIAIPRHGIDNLLDNSPGALRVLFEVLLNRWMATQDAVRHSARMAQLGTLTAGLAHEINNPAAAARRSTGALRGAIARLVRAERSVVEGAGPDEHAIRDQLLAGVKPLFPPPDPLDLSDREDVLRAQLESLGVEDAGRLAADLADLRGLEGLLAHDAGPKLLEAAATRRTVDRLVAEIAMALDRVSAVVDALKSHSHLDRGSVVDTDIAAGIRDTLTILRSALTGIRVELEIPPDLPTVEAYGGELAQVWTNLIDNAADALSGTPDPAIRIRAFADDDTLTVEIEDNGPGIPTEARERVFDAFYTTKPPGEGTGLGLKISHEIVVDRHGGAIEFETESGRTLFRVTLPRAGATVS